MVDQRTTDSHASRLSNDVPLSDPAEDGLHRRKFAKHLADSILAIDPSDGFVFALTGPWGSGKTTILNFTKKLLEDKTAEGTAGTAGTAERTAETAERTAEQDNRLVIVHFNAWWVSESDKLLQHFFKQFRSAFGDKESKKIWGTLTEYAVALERLPYIGPLAAVAHRLERVKAVREADINGSRQKVDEDLKKFPGRILVVIDDLDRLRPGGDPAGFPSRKGRCQFSSDDLSPGLR